MTARPSAFGDKGPVSFEEFRDQYPELSDEAAAAKYERYLQAWEHVQKLGGKDGDKNGLP